MRRAFLWLALPVLGVLLGIGATPMEAGPAFHCNQVNVHPNGLPNGQVGTAYSALVWLTPANPLLQVTVTSMTGTPPPGLVFVPGPNLNQVTLVGTPTTPGTYTFTVEIGGVFLFGAICKVLQTYTVTITP